MSSFPRESQEGLGLSGQPSGLNENPSNRARVKYQASGQSSNRTTEYNERTIAIAWLALLWGILIAPIMLRLADPAAVPFRGDALGPATFQGGSSTLLFAATHLGVLGLGAAAIVVSLRYRHSLSSGFLLWLGIVALSFGPFLSAFLGYEPGLTAMVVRLPIILTAAYMLPPVDPIWFVTKCKRAVEFFLYLTVAVLIVMPDQVLQLGYDASLIPGWTFRLHGIGLHANGLATLVLGYLILGWIVPARTRSEWFSLAVAISCLVMTQSKTVWLLVLVAYAIRAFYVSGWTRVLIPYAGVTVTLVFLLILTNINPSWDRGIAETILDDDVVTLTGRTQLWESTIDVWRQSPVFGYGPHLWGEDMSLDYEALHGWMPGSSHNQFVHTLGQSGIVGVVGLAFFIVVVLTYAVRYRKPTSGVSLAIGAMIVLRSITEDPLRGAINEGTFILFVFVSLLFIVEAHVQERRSSLQYRTDRPPHVQLRTPVVTTARSPILDGRLSYD